MKEVLMPENTVVRRALEARAAWQHVGTPELDRIVHEGAICRPDPDLPLQEQVDHIERWWPITEVDGIRPDALQRRHATQAKWLCAPCPVREACLAKADRHAARFRLNGVWGGLPEHELTALTVHRARERQEDGLGVAA
jgi:hypothetical protein